MGVYVIHDMATRVAEILRSITFNFVPSGLLWKGTNNFQLCFLIQELETVLNQGASSQFITLE